MKIKAIKLKTTLFIVLVAWSISGFAQGNRLMYVMRNDTVVYQSPVSDIENVTFDEISSSDTLVIDKSDGSLACKIQVINIQQLSFLNDSLYIETLSRIDEYALDDIVKLIFENGNITEIHNPSLQSGDGVLVSLTTAGDVIVESPVAIKSLILFSIDGKMIFKQHYDGVKTQCAVSLRNSVAGIYLLCVETTQATVVKKIVKQ